MKTKSIFTILFCILALAAFGDNGKKAELAFIKENTAFAQQQLSSMIHALPNPDTANIETMVPYSIDSNGTLVTCKKYWWTIGFFPGSLWKLYELSGDKQWLNQAQRWTNRLEYLKTFTDNHDLGFMVYCSFGNALRLAPKPHYKEIIIESARSLSTRFNPKTAVIKSWNSYKGWDGLTKCNYPVIIDNMMNLELLCEASKMSNNPTFQSIAVTHANTTLKNHFRADYSSYHVVDYDTITGEVKHRITSQGYSDNSTWARGQAWAIYGYTMMYRETQKAEYLKAASGAADYFLSHLPEDGIPWWDFNVGQAGYTPDKNSYALHNPQKIKDASAAAITCSALFELGELAGKPTYTKAAIRMLHTLASPAYRAESGKNSNFILMHCVGSFAHNSNVDTPLDYADYYFLESLTRYKKLLEKK
ncbi:MAG: glycoside hydrolase family 88 protein [Bacteroidales bacterium]|nr:glycoside hydrolase family 88 protein [Bacteroidales bacterium]